MYFTYAKNLDHFTLGQGGYFSPQSYFAALLPLTFTRRLDNLTWSVGGSVGAQSYTENSSPVFPNNGALQSQLDALAAGNPTIVDELIPARRRPGSWAACMAAWNTR